MSKVILVNPANATVGYSVITPRWLFVIAGATPVELVGDPVVIDALRARLTDPDNPVRRMAVESLGQLGDAGSFDAILQVLESADDPFFEASAVANLAANEPSLRPRARAAITSWAKRRSSPDTDRNLALYLRQIGDDDD